MGLPPPPPGYSPPKTRPGVVTKYTLLGLILSLIVIAIGVVNLAWYPTALTTAIGAIVTVIGVFYLIVSFGFFIGQGWAFTLSGYSHSQWASTPEVQTFFGRSASSLGAPAPPPAATCSTCGQPLTFVQQYQRWYCANEQKYL